MTSIIRGYKEVSYSSIDAIVIAQQIIKIYWELRKNNIAYSEIISWVEEDLAQHWWATAEFLKFCFEKYDDLTPEISSLDFDKNFSEGIVIFSGITNFLSLEPFLYPKESIVVLPPYNKNSETNISYQDHFEYLERKYDKFFHLATIWQSINDNSTKTVTINNYIEFYDIFEEADYLFHKIRSCNSSITIILQNYDLMRLISDRLDLLCIEYNSSFGIAYNSFLEVELLINLAKFKSTAGDITSFISVLKSRIFLQDEILSQFVQSISHDKKFYEDFEAILLSLSLERDSYISSILKLLEDLLRFDSIIFSELFQKLLSCFISLYEHCNISTINNDAEKFKSFVLDIKDLKYQDFKIDIEEFAAFLHNIFALKYTKPFNREANIYFLTPEEALLIDTEQIIFADFNNESYLMDNMEDIWLSKKILKKLKLFDESNNFKKLLYIISSKIDKQKCYFTRSKYNKGELLEKCSILNLIPNLEQIYVSLENISITMQNNRKEVLINLDLFPKILYATNIEQLIRDPYGFFARKILEVKKRKDLFSKPENTDFGQIVHQLIENLSLQHNLLVEEEINLILTERGIQSNFALLWKNALIGIASGIKKINAEILNQGGQFLCEIEGEYELALSSTTIKLRAIADRIEIFSDKIRIIDFKTGAIPAKKDVFQGKIPQLVIEAIILQNGGFDIAKKFNDIKPEFKSGFCNDKILELVYIKVNSKEPYFEETIVKMEPHEIEEHYDALREFLNYYYTQKEISIDSSYLPEFWKPIYDDYAYFRRVIL